MLENLLPWAEMITDPKICTRHTFAKELHVKTTINTITADVTLHKMKTQNKTADLTRGTHCCYQLPAVQEPRMEQWCLQRSRWRRLNSLTLNLSYSAGLGQNNRHVTCYLSWKEVSHGRNHIIYCSGFQGICNSIKFIKIIGWFLIITPRLYLLCEIIIW